MVAAGTDSGGIVDVPPAVRPWDSGRTYEEIESSTVRGLAASSLVIVKPLTVISRPPTFTSASLEPTMLVDALEEIGDLEEVTAEPHVVGQNR